MASRMSAELKKEIITQMIVCDTKDDPYATSFIGRKCTIKEAYKMGIIHRLNAFTRLYDLLDKKSTVNTFVSVNNWDSCVKEYLEL